MRQRLNHLDVGFLAAALLPLAGILPTLGDGIIRSADGPLHVQRMFAMTILLASGELWPRWVPYFHLGYGYPIFNFYPPGVFYLGGLLGLLGIPAAAAFNLIAALAWVIGTTGVYRLARRLLAAEGALLAAALWAYAPSRLYEVWDQGSLPQMMAAALVPWIFHGLARLAKEPSRRRILGFSLPLAGMILCHQPITLIAGLFIAPAALTLCLAAGRSPRALAWRLLSVGVGAALAAGLAAIFLLPLAAELRYVQAASQAPDVIPYLTSNFLQPEQIFSQPPLLDLTDLRYKLPTTLGLLGGLLGAFGLLALLRQRHFGAAALLAAGLTFALFMMVEPSLLAWQAIPFMPQLRFPERFLRLASILLALAGGASLLLLPARRRGAGLVIGLALAVAAALPLVYPSRPFTNWPNQSALDEIRMEETEHIWGTTSYDEFNPIWGEQPGWDAAVEPEAYVTDPLRIVVNRVDMARYGDILQVEQLGSATVRVRLERDFTLRFRQFYFPGWTATVNGQPASIYPEAQVGQIALDLPAGEYTITLAYTGTDIQRVGTIITLASLGIAAMLYLTGRSPSPAQSGADKAQLSPRLGAGIGLGAVAFSLVNALIIAPHTLWFRHRSPPDAPVYMQTPVRQPFGDQFELLGFTLPGTTTAPGDLLPITLYWRALQTSEREYRPVVQLVNLTQSQAWAVSEPLFPGGGKTPTYPPDRFASDPHSLRVFNFAPPYMGRISVQMLDAATDEPLRLPDGADRLLLDPLIRVERPTRSLPLALGHRFDDRLELRCATLQRSGGEFIVALGWHVIAALDQDLMTFVHGLDSGGELVAQGDAPPLDGDYPTRFWLPGQNLIAVYRLPDDSALETVAVGLYTPERRLSVTLDGAAVANDQVVLPLDEQSCPP